MKKPLDLKKAHVHRPTGTKRDQFVLKDGAKTVGKSEHSTNSDSSIQRSAANIVKQARRLGRKIKTKSGWVIDPGEEDDDDEELAELVITKE